MGVLFGGIQRKGVDHKKVVKNLTKEQRAMYSEKKNNDKEDSYTEFLNFSICAQSDTDSF